MSKDEMYAEILPLRVEERCGGYAVVDGKGVDIVWVPLVNSHRGLTLDKEDPRRRDEKRTKKVADWIASELSKAGAT